VAFKEKKEIEALKRKVSLDLMLCDYLNIKLDLMTMHITLINLPMDALVHFCSTMELVRGRGRGRGRVHEQLPL